MYSQSAIEPHAIYKHLINAQGLWDITTAQIKVQIRFGLFSARMLYIALLVFRVGYTPSRSYYYIPNGGVLTLVSITFREENPQRAVLCGTQRQVNCQADF